MNLPLVAAFIFLYHRLNFQLPIVWILEFDFVATIARIRLLAHCEQF